MTLGPRRVENWNGKESQKTLCWPREMTREFVSAQAVGRMSFPVRNQPPGPRCGEDLYQP